MRGQVLPVPAPTTAAPTSAAPATSAAPTTTAAPTVTADTTGTTGTSEPPTTSPAVGIPRIPTAGEGAARLSSPNTTPELESPLSVAGVITKGDCEDGCIFVGDFQAD
jgi:hypothetical protein